MPSPRKATIIGAGPNGLSAAVVLAQAGLQVEVFEAEATAGGAARTMELTLPGFLHDFGSAVHPMAAGSPFFNSLPMQQHGLEWIHSPAPVAHALDDGTAVVLERNLVDAKKSLGVDGNAWEKLMQPFAGRWTDFASEILRPLPAIPKHPFLMARFGLHAMLSAKTIASRFQSERTRALFAGFAAHSFLAFDEPLSGAFALSMAIPAHAVGWPIAHGGSQSIANALCSLLITLGGKVTTSQRVDSLDALPKSDLILCDVTPRQLIAIAGNRLSENFQRKMKKFRYGPGVFKVDYALSEPIPWRAADCQGRVSSHPFILLAQPTLFDPSRAPASKHIAWAYCHVPNGCKENVLPNFENQIERFAPGFRETVLARRIFSPADLEEMDANLVGGDIGGGIIDIRQFLFRPTRQHYATSAKNLYLCSASTPPGGAVHGMCGYHAARTALAKI